MTPFATFLFQLFALVGTLVHVVWLVRSFTTWGTK